MKPTNPHLSSRILSSLAAACLLTLPAQAVLVAHYGLEEGTGTTTASSVAGPPTGTLLSGATWTTGIAPGSQYALSFTGSDGANGKVTVNGTNVWNNVSGFTVSAWIQPTVFSGAGATAKDIFWLGTGDSARFTIQINDFGDLRAGGRRLTGQTFTSLGTNTGASNGSAGDPLQLGNVYHVAATVDYTSGLVSLYLDGVLVQSGDLSGAWGLGTTDDNGGAGYNIRIGGHNNSTEPFGGLIDDVQIYNHTLSAAEVAALAAVPEPATAALGALAGLALLRRRRR